MKMKEFGPPGGGGARPWRPPLRSANELYVNVNDFWIRSLR